MRLIRATVDSFGPLKNREFKFASGLNVFSGPNGCGKTALAEFLGACLVPSGKKTLPERGKNDSGSITADDGGTETVIRIRGLYRTGRIPDFLLGMEPEFYRNVHFISSGTAGDLSWLEETFASAESLSHPLLASAAEKARITAESALGPELSMIEDQIAETESAAETLQAEANRYGEYASQAEAIRKMMRMESDDSPEAEEFRRLAVLRETHRHHYGRLAELAASRRALDSFEWVGISDIAAYESMVAELKEASEAAESMEEMMYGPMTLLGGIAPEDVYAQSREIRKLAEGRESYARNTRELRDRRTELAGAKMGAPRKRAQLFRRETESKDDAADISGLTRRIADLTRMTESYEESASRVSYSLGIMMPDTEQAVAEMVRMMDAADVLSEHREALADSRIRLEKAESTLARFLERFGGEEGFAECRIKTEKARAADAETAEIRRILSEAGLNPDEPVCAAEYMGASGDRKSLEKRLSYLEEKMSRILGSGELESLLDRKAALTARRNAAVRRGMTAAFACAIADRAGGGANKLRPDLDAAGAYLSEMAGRECRLSWDRKILLSDGGPPAPLETAGGGMVKMASIALKLAAAEASAGGEVPMILDEPFAGLDQENKSGACRAVRSAARKMQIIIFTSDRETNEIFSSMSGTAIFNMGMPKRDGSFHATI